MQGGSLEPEASSDLDSSRRTLNQGTMEEDTEREFGGAGLIVELSKSEQSRRSMSSSDEDSIDKEQEDYKFLAGVRNMFINHSLPKPYNPGKSQDEEFEVIECRYRKRGSYNKATIMSFSSGGFAQTDEGRIVAMAIMPLF